MEELQTLFESLLALLTSKLETEDIEFGAVTSDQEFELSFDFTKFRDYSIQVNWKDFDVGDGSFKIQKSVDGERYEDIPGATSALTVSTDQFKVFDLDDLRAISLKIVYTKGTDTTGEIEEVTILGKPKFS